jgi:cellulose biosynthesis protein BcsQ
MGLIVTFYSFKGGVGRTMALANIGVLLAQRDLKTLLVDWDLEAPGLSNYFKNLDHSGNSTGLFDLLLVAHDRNEQIANWRDYASDVHMENGCNLSIITSGLHDEEYATKLARLNWTDFFARKNGGEFIENLRSEWKQEYDLTLIDSRTGLTDSGGICTIQMPDVVVAVFTPNDQNLDGIADVLPKAQDGLNVWHMIECRCLFYLCLPASTGELRSVRRRSG